MKKTLCVLLILLIASPCFGFGGRGIESAGLSGINYTAAQVNATLGLQQVITCTGTAATDKAAIDAALTALQTAGGGTMVIVGVCRYDDQLTMPNDGGTGVWTGIFHQAPIRITGVGGADANGRWSATSATPASALDLRYATGAVGKIVSLGVGYLEIDHLTIMAKNSSSGGNVPFLLATNTTVNIHDNTFKGWSSTVANTNDGIVLGGTTGDAGNLTTSPFQGYGTKITNNWFDQIRQAVVLNKWANNVVVEGNTVSNNCGYATGAPFVINGEPGTSSATGNLFIGNLIEGTGYKYGFYLDAAAKNNFIANGIWDVGVSWTSIFGITDYTTNNLIVLSEHNAPSAYSILSGGAGSTLKEQYIIDPLMKATFYQSTTGPAANSCSNSANRGQHYVFNAGSGIADIELTCVKTSGGTYAWRPAYAGYPSSTEIVTNGSFSADTNWTKGSSWYISGGIARNAVNGNCTAENDPADCCTGSGTGTCAGGNIYQSSVVAQYKGYIVTYTVGNRTAGQIYPVAGGQTGLPRTANGTYTEYIYNPATDTEIVFVAQDTFDGSIDDVSVKEFLAY